MSEDPTREGLSGRICQGAVSSQSKAVVRERLWPQDFLCVEVFPGVLSEHPSSTVGDVRVLSPPSTGTVRDLSPCAPSSPFKWSFIRHSFMGIKHVII